MNNFQKLSRNARLQIFGLLLSMFFVQAVIFWACLEVFLLNPSVSLFVVLISGSMLAYVASVLITAKSLKPLQLLWQAIMHVSPHSSVPAPNLDTIKEGKELLNQLILQVYQFASQRDSTDLIEHRRTVVQAANVVSHLPLPLFVFNKNLLVTMASDTAIEYCQVQSSMLLGKPLFDTINLEFPTEHTLENWIEECQTNKVTDKAYWERVRVRLPDGKTLRQCDIAAQFNRENASGAEFIVTLFDRTERYNQDDQSMSFVALAVHELRTPLTMLRGYIEVFEEELSEVFDEEQKEFMKKMEVAAKQLTSFVNNILNVARIEENQLILELHEENWEKVLRNACKDAELKAQIHGKTIEYNITPSLPTVGVDLFSIYEVINNLLDNAIKYSGEGKRIIVSSYLNKEGLVETTVQDFGLGIPVSVLPNLFEKFYRNHRTKSQIGGTGLGLFLCKTIVTAHSGNIWATSKEGEGSVFGFSLLPYSQLADEQKTGNNSDIIRTAHGWIKNHSLYRR